MHGQAESQTVAVWQALNCRAGYGLTQQGMTGGTSNTAQHSPNCTRTISTHRLLRGTRLILLVSGKQLGRMAAVKCGTTWSWLQRRGMRGAQVGWPMPGLCNGGPLDTSRCPHRPLRPAEASLQAAPQCCGALWCAEWGAGGQSWALRRAGGGVRAHLRLASVRRLLNSASPAWNA